jgi:ATP-dependent exoDNAse (exonuclease V) beta subunit
MSQPNKPFKVYQASAGAGKTYTIIKEYLSLCLASEAATLNYRHILAITFTNMAANEMKAKIVDQLNGLIHSHPEQPPQPMEADLLQCLQLDRPTLKRHAQLLFQHILHDYSHFFVCTIDTFVQRLARPFAQELRLPNQFTVSIDEVEVADAITERIGAQIGPDNPFLTRILEDFSGLKLEEEKSPKISQNIHAFVNVLFKEDAYQRNEWNQFTDRAQYDETVKFLKTRTEPFEKQCAAFLVGFDAFCRDYGLRPDDFSYKSKSPCLSLRNKVQAKTFDPPGANMLKLLENPEGWCAKELPAQRNDFDQLQQAFERTFLSFLKYYLAHYGAYLFYREQASMLSLYVLRSVIHAEMDAYIGEEQLVHISEFNKRINEIMGDFSVPFIYERIGEQIKHLFIDEFQDTSLLQWQNLIPLLDNNLADRHFNMVVGDGKQSIYRWRNGEVGQIVSLPKIYDKPENSPAFDDFERNLINYFDFNELKRNFRSFRNIVDFNNAFFAFSANAPYLDEDARKVYIDNDPATGKEVSIEQQGMKTEPGMVQVECFNRQAIDQETLPARVKELIEEVLGNGFRKKDITVLVRENKHGTLIANYLTEQGIEVVSNDSIQLQSSDKVQLILQTLDYLLHPDNPVAIAAVLHYWHACHQEGFTGTVDGFFDHVQAIAHGDQSIEAEMGLPEGALQSLLANAYSLYDLCAALARRYGFNTVGDTYLNFLFDTVFDWQSADQNSIAAFLDYWEKKRSKLTVVTSDTDAVTIMTIHKSKGLEFPVVIYPYANDDLGNSRGTTLWIAPEQLGFEPLPHIGKIQFNLSDKRAQWNPSVQAVYEQEQRRIRLDNLNLFYVAFTRAIQRLYILSYQGKDDGRYPLNDFLNRHQEQWVTKDTDRIVYRLGDPSTPKVKDREDTPPLPNTYHESRSSEWFDKISIDPDPSMFWISREDRMKPQEWGDFVHQVLSEIEHEADMDRALRPHLDAGVIDASRAQQLKDLFLKMMHHPVIGRAFLPEARVKNECEILSHPYGILRPDRYAELPDKIYLLDYKTGKPAPAHHAQLQRYGAVLQKMVSKPIEAYLVYLGEEVEAVPVEIQLNTI